MGGAGEMSKARGLIAVVFAFLAVGSISGCIQFGDYVGESKLGCSERAVSFETYLGEEEGLDTVSVRPAGTGTAGQCVIEVLIEVPRSSSQQDIAAVSTIALDAVEFAGYTPSETKLDIQVEDGELLNVLPPSK
jgi:hypothetical protein